jgi:hypothetical protein
LHVNNTVPGKWVIAEEAAFERRGHRLLRMAFDGECLSKITSSAVGGPEPPSPPELVLQFVVAFQMPVPVPAA